MLLSQIKLHNFAAFEGEHAIDLSLKGSDQCNIILIGAMNGSGKTTLLDAVKLCLYGAAGSGLLLARQSEREFVSARLNYNARERGDSEMWVDLTFSGVEQGEITHQIQVKRTWKFDRLNGNYEDEEFAVHKDGKPLELVAKEHWPQFIEELMPTA